MNKNRLTAYALLLLVSIIWGVAGPVIKFTLREFPPLIFLTYRFAISALVAFIAWRGLPRLPQSSTKITHMILYSILAVPLALVLLFLGFEKTSSLEGTLIASIAPLFTIIAAGVVFHEHVTKIERIGISIAIAGTLLTVFEPLIRNGSAYAQSSFIGNLLIVVAMIAETIGFLFAKRLVREEVAPQMLSHFSFVVGFALITPIALLSYSPGSIAKTITSASVGTHLGVLFMALISGTLAYGLKNKVIKTIELSEASVFSYLSPVWAAPLALLWLGESVSWIFVLGAAFIALGVTIAEYKRHRKKKKDRR